MRFLRFSVRQALQGLWRNRVMNIAATVTMVLMLILLSALVILISGVEAGLEYIESKVEVRAELHDGLRSESVTDFKLHDSGDKNRHFFCKAIWFNRGHRSLP